jgi:hypothetical protein
MNSSLPLKNPSIQEWRTMLGSEKITVHTDVALPNENPNAYRKAINAFLDAICESVATRHPHGPYEKNHFFQAIPMATMRASAKLNPGGKADHLLNEIALLTDARPDDGVFARCYMWVAIAVETAISAVTDKLLEREPA